MLFSENRTVLSWKLVSKQFNNIASGQCGNASLLQPQFNLLNVVNYDSCQGTNKGMQKREIIVWDAVRCVKAPKHSLQLKLGVSMQSFIYENDFQVLAFHVFQQLCCIVLKARAVYLKYHFCFCFCWTDCNAFLFHTSFLIKLQTLVLFLVCLLTGVIFHSRRLVRHLPSREMLGFTWNRTWNL